LDLLCRYVIGRQAGLFYIQHLLNTRLILLLMMTTNWLLMYVYRLIIWYEKLKKQQQLSKKVSMRRDETYCGQYYAQFMSWWTSRGWGGWTSWSGINGRWDYLSWKYWGCWFVHEHFMLVHERPRSIHKLGWYWLFSHLHGYYRLILEVDKLGWYSTLVRECSRPLYEPWWILYIVTCYYMLWELWIDV